MNFMQNVENNFNSRESACGAGVMFLVQMSSGIYVYL